MSDNFYRDFEDIHRGDRQDIMRRLQVYLPFVRAVVQSHANVLCLDLGCGRGEWLQLLTEQSIPARGVDLDPGMLQVARSKGLNVSQDDAVKVLQDLPDSSVSVVSAFHLVEHLAFQDLQTLILHAQRVLVPGGLLILETPNPDNLQVATCNFHLDPSHLKPLPSALLAFMTQHAGFFRSKILGLQESPSLRFQDELQLQDVLSGASPDYAVVAQKHSSTGDFDSLAHLFNRHFGISTAELAQAYSAQQKKMLREIRIEMNDLRSKLDQVTEKNHRLELQVAQVQLDSQAQINAIHADFQSRIHAIHADFQSRIQGIHDSVIWRISKPFQWAWDQARRLRQEGFSSRLHAFVRKIKRLVITPSAQVPGQQPNPAPDTGGKTLQTSGSSEPSAEVREMEVTQQPDKADRPRQ